MYAGSTLSAAARLSSSRGQGDVNAVRRGNVGRRVARKVYGKVAGRLARKLFG